MTSIEQLIKQKLAAALNEEKKRMAATLLVAEDVDEEVNIAEMQARISELKTKLPTAKNPEAMQAQLAEMEKKLQPKTWQVVDMTSNRKVGTVKAHNHNGAKKAATKAGHEKTFHMVMPEPIDESLISEDRRNYSHEDFLPHIKKAGYKYKGRSDSGSSRYEHKFVHPKSGHSVSLYSNKSGGGNAEASHSEGGMSYKPGSFAAIMASHASKS